MRSLFSKIFLTFWMAMILIIFTTALVSSKTTEQHFLVSHPIIEKISDTNKSLLKNDDFFYRDLILNITITILISGIICYLLSLYLTKPLRTLTQAAKQLGTGNLTTRVGHFVGHSKDEIEELKNEFNRMAEHIEEIILSKERLLQDISHELRSPLARLHIALELARQKYGAQAEKELSRIELETLRLNTLISEILEFSRLEKSNEIIKKEMINLNELINQIVMDANFEHGEENPRVIISETLPVIALLDKRLIQRALENIIRNALHYSPYNTKVDIKIYLDEKDNIIITITDQGEGVPENDIEKIFNPFFRVDSAREKTTGGYGLGLSIAKEAIKLHHGWIKAKNLPQGGLELKIFLPVA